MPAARSRVVPGTLRRNAQLSLGRLAVLFSDLSGSTAYYESAGDAEACAFVLEHFEIVRAVIESTGGVLLKTIGDAVLALYSDEEAAAVGALRIAHAVRRHLAERGRLADLGLKLAVHGGTGFLVREGDRLDVYGRTVNRAARLESQASQGEIVFEASAFDALPTRVQDRFTVARRFAFEAKGVTTAMRAVACLARPEAT
jgi:class 3 adenylate cyclase